MNPFKITWRIIKAGGKGARKVARIAYRQATRPEVMAALQIGGVVVPGLNALGVLTFLRLVKQAEQAFPARGSGKQKATYVMKTALKMAPQLKKWGVPTSEWKDLIEGAVLMMHGRASLVSDVDGKELSERDLYALAAIFDEAA